MGYTNKELQLTLNILEACKDLLVKNTPLNYNMVASREIMKAIKRVKKDIENNNNKKE